MPARRAASALPPTAKMWRPKRVRGDDEVEHHHEARRGSDARSGSAAVLVEAPTTANDDRRRRRPRRARRRADVGSVAQPGAQPRAGGADEPIAGDSRRRRRAAMIQPTRREKNVPARPVIDGSVRLIVPVSPSTYSSAPCQASRPASVTTNDGMPKRVTDGALEAPDRRAGRERRRRSPGPGPSPCFDVQHRHDRRARPLTAPTERSISPSSSTSTTPTEISARRPRSAAPGWSRFVGGEEAVVLATGR